MCRSPFLMCRSPYFMCSGPFLSALKPHLQPHWPLRWGRFLKLRGDFGTSRADPAGQPPPTSTSQESLVRHAAADHTASRILEAKV
jgi:hypothetical protein